MMMYQKQTMCPCTSHVAYHVTQLEKHFLIKHVCQLPMINQYVFGIA